MIKIEHFWMIYYHGHQVFQKEFERTDNLAAAWQLFIFNGTYYLPCTLKENNCIKNLKEHCTNKWII